MIQRLLTTLSFCLLLAIPASAESYTLTKDTVAFNPASPSEALGQFKAGSKLEIGKVSEVPDMFHVTYLTPDGKLIAALCRAEDVGKAPPSGKPAVAINLPPPGSGGFSNSAVFQSIKADLVNPAGQAASSDKLGKSKYALVYFSAHWCPPCRKFTPELVEFYNQNANKNFDIVFVSSDESANDMRTYMTETKMPWNGIRFGSFSHKYLDEKFSGTGIPCLVMLDSDGKVVSHSYVNGKYVGPHKVLNDLKAKL